MELGQWVCGVKEGESENRRRRQHEKVSVIISFVFRIYHDGEACLILDSDPDFISPAPAAYFQATSCVYS